MRSCFHFHWNIKTKNAEAFGIVDTFSIINSTDIFGSETNKNSKQTSTSNNLKVLDQNKENNRLKQTICVFRQHLDTDS